MSTKTYTALYIASYLSTIVLPRAILIYFWWLNPIKFCANNASMLICVYASNLDMLFRLMLVGNIQSYWYKIGLMSGLVLPIGCDLASAIVFKVGCDSNYVIPWFPSILVTLAIHTLHALLCLIVYNTVGEKK